MGKANLRPMGKRSEMRLIAGGVKGLSRGDGLRRLLDKDKLIAHELGQMLVLSREGFSMAFPKETRVTKIETDDWAKAGHDDVADVVRLMGLEAC